MIGLLAAAGLVWQATGATLAVHVTNSGNSWQSGVVRLTDNDQGLAMFGSSETNLAPGTGPAKCIEVTFAGDVPGEVRLYVPRLDNYGEQLDTALIMRIDMGSGSSCAVPGRWTALSQRTVRATADAAATWATGLAAGAWRPSGDAAQTRPFRFTPTLAADNAIQGDRLQVDFVWEARST